MTCSNCGQELKEDAKFCTKCGTSFKTTNLALPITSIILSVIGIGLFLLRAFLYLPISFFSSGDMLLHFSIIVALIALNKQKSLIGFVAGLIPCVFLIILDYFRF